MTDEEGPDGVPPPAPLERARAILSGRGHSLSEGAVRVLAREVLRQLSRAHGAQPVPGQAFVVHARELALALAGADEDAPRRLVAEAEARGFDLDALHRNLIAEAVRCIGAMWDEDVLSLGDVVVGTGRVYVLLRELRDRFLLARAEQVDHPRALFATVPGEIHTLGAVMAADHFRARGWAVDLHVGARQADIVAAAKDHLIVVLAARLPASILPLARRVVPLRVANPAAYVVVAGGIVAAEPQIAALVDADAAAADLAAAERCLDQARALVMPPSPPARR